MMRKDRALFVSAWGLVVVLALAAAAGDRVTIKPRAGARESVGAARTVRMDVRLIFIPVTVTDTFGAPFQGLPRDAFRLYEDGVEQDLRYFSAEDSPLSVGVVFDASGSMEEKLDQSRAAVAQVFRQSMPGDEFFLVEFNSIVRMLCGFTSDPGEIERRMGSIQARGSTALLDAVYMASHYMKHARNGRRSLLILSDGGDNFSRYTEREMKSLVRESGVCIYSIALVGGGLFRRHVKLLRELSEETGGHVLEVENLGGITEAVQKINRAMRYQYMLGYSSTNPNNNGQYRKIQVKLATDTKEPPLRAAWRSGYYAPDAW